MSNEEDKGKYSVEFGSFFSRPPNAHRSNCPLQCDGKQPCMQVIHFYVTALSIAEPDILFPY